MFTEKCVIHAFLVISGGMFFFGFVTNVKHDKHTIRIMFKYDYKYAILLDKLNLRFHFFFNLDTLNSGWWGKSPPSVGHFHV